MDSNVRNLSSFPSSDQPGEESLNRGSAASSGKAASGAHAVVDKAAEAAKPAVERAAQYAHDAVDRAASAAAPAAQWVSEKSEKLRVTQKQVVDDTCNYISANPLTSVGLAAAMGFLIGRMAR
jgi:ElaB/YqjD/DUF883 family membrane-anchored ribosome-binding protein